MARRRRKKGTGSIFESGGRWIYRSPEGDRITRGDRDSLERAVRAVEQAKARGLDVLAGKASFSALGQEWLEWIGPRVRPSTLDNYRAKLALVIPVLGHKQIGKLAFSDFDKLWIQLLQEGRAPSSVRAVRTTCSQILKFGIKRGALVRNAASESDPPRGKKKERKSWTRQEARAFLEASRGEKLEALWWFLLLRGPRISEALGLRKTRLDLDTASIKIDCQLGRLEGKWVLLPPKTEASERVISIPPQLLQSLQRHQTKELEKQLRSGPAWEGEAFGLVFTGRHGGPLSRSYVARQFHRIRKKAELRRLTLHDLRSTFATLALEAGIPLPAVRDTLGHAGSGMTMDIYSKTTPDAERQSAERVELAMWG